MDAWGRGQGGGAHHKGFRDVLGELTPQEAEACVGECQCLGDSPVTGGTRWADTVLADPTWEADLGSEATVPSFKVWRMGLGPASQPAAVPTSSGQQAHCGWQERWALGVAAPSPP